MKKALFLIIVMVTGFIGTAAAQSYPSYYPAEEFMEIGVIDVVYLDEGRIIIGDMPYLVSPEAVVRSLSSREDSLARLRVGAKVGFKMSGGVITEFWLLPNNYKQKR